jgi:arginase family enzyme
MEASMNAPSHDDMTKRVRAYSKFMDFKFYSGIATFFRANLCDDWTEVDIALVGLPTDIGLTQRTGARHGPREIRSQSSNVPYYNPLTKIIPFELARIADIGDVQLVSAFNLDNVIAEIGTGTPAVGGITSYEAKRLLQGLHGTDIVGADVVEVSPPFDTGGVTALAGAQLIFEMLCLAAESFARRAKR